jgi:hypothetical protein
VGSLRDSKRLLVQLKVLLGDGRTFVHKIRPLYFNDVRRWRRLGRRYLEQVYGKDSADSQRFSRLTEQAFSFLPTRSGHVYKVEVIEGTECIVVGGDQDSVSHLNRLEFNNALHILIDAARRLRDELAAEGKSAPPNPVSAHQDQRQPRGQHGAAQVADNASVGAVEYAPQSVIPGGLKNNREFASERRAIVQAFLVRCNRELSFKVLKKHIWSAAKHKTGRQFQHWQASSEDATTQDNATFPQILAMSPQAFHERLSKLNVEGVPAVETR